MLTLKQGLIASSLSVLNQLVRRLVGIVSVIILARVLTPEDFGLVAIALIFFNFVNVTTEIGTRSYLLSREVITDEMVLTGWTLSFFIKNTIAIVLAGASFFIAEYYDDPRLLPIVLVFAMQVFIGALTSPGLIYKDKYQELGPLIKWQVISRLITTGITIAVAVIYKTYWALVIGQVLITVSNVIASYYIAPMKLVFTFKNVSEQWRFSKWILPQSLINFFRSQIDAIYVSSTFDKASMGAYNSMRYYANIPTTVFIKPVLGTSLTQFSEFKNNAAYFTRQLQVAFFAISALAVPAMFLIYEHAHFAVGFVLGAHWLEYSELLAIFSLIMIVTAINGIVSHVAMLKDATKLLLIYSVICILVQGTLFITIEFTDVFQLATYKIIADVILASLFYLLVVGTLVGWQALKTITPPVFQSFLCMLIAAWLTALIPAANHGLMQFILHSTTFTIIYVALQFLVMFSLRKRVHCHNYILNKTSVLMNKIANQMST